MTNTALIVVDVQNDFCKGGSLAVPDGDAVVDVINSLREKLPPTTSLVCLTQDWHPVGHVSFQSTHACQGAELFKPFKLPDGTEQMMWPDHCVQCTKGSQFHDRLVVKGTDKLINKGTDPNMDSYSAFFDNDKAHHTDLDQILKAAQITRVIIVGLAFDYCVGYTALDAVGLGYKAIVVEDATRPVAPDSASAMRKRLLGAGVELMSSGEVERAATKEIV